MPENNELQFKCEIHAVIKVGLARRSGLVRNISTMPLITVSHNLPPRQDPEAQSYKFDPSLSLRGGHCDEGDRSQRNYRCRERGWQEQRAEVDNENVVIALSDIRWL